MTTNYDQLVKESQESGNHHITYIYEQQKEAYEYALAYAQEVVYLLQKRITEIEKLEEAYHKKFVSLAAALKKDAAFMLKERKLRELKENK